MRRSRGTCEYCRTVFTRSEPQKRLHFESVHPQYSSPPLPIHEWECSWCNGDSSFKKQGNLWQHQIERCKEGDQRAEERRRLKDDRDKRQRDKELQDQRRLDRKLKRSKPKPKPKPKRRKAAAARHLEEDLSDSWIEHETLWRDPLSEPDNNLEPESDEQLSDHGPAFLPASVAGTSSTWPNLSIDNAGVVGSHHPGFVPHGRDDTLMPDLFGRHRFEARHGNGHEHSLRKGAPLSLRQARIYRRSQTGFEAQF